MGLVWQYFKTIIGVIFRHPITGTTIIPVLPNGQIVLMQRKDSGKWGLPGGLVDWGEDIPTAAKRELKEETGLELLKIRRLVGVYSSPHRDPRVHSISVVIEAEVKGEFQPEDTLEVLDVKAFTISELPIGTLCHDHDQQLKDYLAGLTVVA